jgi:hypothetical protein
MVPVNEEDFNFEQYSSNFISSNLNCHNFFKYDFYSGNINSSVIYIIFICLKKKEEDISLIFQYFFREDKTILKTHLNIEAFIHIFNPYF